MPLRAYHLSTVAINHVHLPRKKLTMTEPKDAIAKILATALVSSQGRSRLLQLRQRWEVLPKSETTNNVPRLGRGRLIASHSPNPDRTYF